MTNDDLDTPTSEQTCSCPDYAASASSRRSFLRNAAAVTGGAVATAVFGETFRQAAYGQLAGGNVMVVLSLRGGADGLSMVVPHGDQHYYAQRPHIAIPKRPLLFKDDMFGLHPRFAPLSAMWRNKKFAVVHAVGLPQPNRSHFSAIEEIEDADLGSPARVGWINRLVGLDSGHSALQAVGVGDGVTPTSLYGRQPTLSIESVEDISLSGAQQRSDTRRARRRALAQVWNNSHSPLGRGARASLATTATLADALSHSYRPANGARYPVGSLGDALKDTARLIKARVGVEVVTLDHGTWDMHSHLGTLTAGGNASMRGMVDTLSHALAAFFTDFGRRGQPRHLGHRHRVRASAEGERLRRSRPRLGKCHVGDGCGRPRWGVLRALARARRRGARGRRPQGDHGLPKHHLRDHDEAVQRDLEQGLPGFHTAPRRRDALTAVRRRWWTGPAWTGPARTAPKVS